MASPTAALLLAISVLAIALGYLPLACAVTLTFTKPSTVAVTFDGAINGALPLSAFRLLKNGAPISWGASKLSVSTDKKKAIITLVNATTGAGTYTVLFTNRPRALCAALGPASLSGAKLIGTGTPASCTEAAVRTALLQAGIYRFNCGPRPVTITLTQEIPLPRGSPDQNCCNNPVSNPPVVLDGQGLVTIRGAGSNRLFSLDNFNFVMKYPQITFQNLAFVNGNYLDTSTGKGGGVYYGLGGSVDFINCDFYNNKGPSPGQDTAGGAINTVGGARLRVSGCRFVGNSASNGGAIGVLQTKSVSIINSYLLESQASGTGGNPGNGGNGGAVSMDGSQALDLHLCGVVFSRNKAQKHGGSLFRTTNLGLTGLANASVLYSIFDRNEAPNGNSGGLYLQGGSPDIRNSFFTRNIGGYTGAIYLSWGTGRSQIANTYISNNTAVVAAAGGLDIDGQAPVGVLDKLSVSHSIVTYRSGALRGSPGKFKLSRSVIDEACWGPGYTGPSAPGGCGDLYVNGGNNFQADASCGASYLCSNPITRGAAATMPILGPTQFCLNPGPVPTKVSAGATCSGSLIYAGNAASYQGGAAVSTLNAFVSFVL